MSNRPFLRIFFDMDGVVANFAQAALDAHGAPDYFKENKQARGDSYWDLAQNLGLEPDEFWAPLKDRDFWAGLKPHADGFAMVMNAYMNHDAVLYMLTYPYRSEGCYAGKFYWFMKHLSDSIPYGHLFMAKEKQLFAHDKHCLLIDDNTSNCKAFAEAGGRSFLVGRPWNARHWLEPVNIQACAEVIQEMEDEIEVQTERSW